jgi:hypothetical protein
MPWSVFNNKVGIRLDPVVGVVKVLVSFSSILSYSQPFVSKLAFCGRSRFRDTVVYDEAVFSNVASESLVGIAVCFLKQNGKDVFVPFLLQLKIYPIQQRNVLSL